jgi:uncharacterized protein (DUF1778 family)
MRGYQKHHVGEIIMAAPKTVDRATTTKGQGRARLEARITREQKELFERAAALESRTLTDFITTHLEPIAEEVVSQHHRIVLSARGAEAFVELLLNPPAPNDNLRAAFDFRRKSQVG